MLHALLHQLHRATGRFRTVATLAVYARNQINCVIAAHLGETPDPRKNGEFALLDVLAPQCRTFVDVGANRGEWSSHFLTLAPATGTLFEPGRQLFDPLKERFRGASVEIVPLAVSDREGPLEFVEDALAGEGSAAAETFDRRLPVRSVSTVECTTLDAFFGPSARLDFVKIDTEGYDLKVLCGARLLLESKRIRFLQFEYNSHWLGAGSSLRMAHRLLERCGYRVFLIRSSGLHELRLELWGDYFRYSNYFACRVEDLEHVSSLLRGRL